MLRTLLFSYLCIPFLAGQSPAIAQQNNNWNNQLGQSGWQSPPNTQSQPQQWQAPQSQGQWQSGGWQPINSNNQAGPSYYGNATTTQPNDQYQAPGAYLNQSNPSGAFNDSINGTATTPTQINQTTNTTPNQTQQGQVHKHEGLKNTLAGMSKALETAATVAAPVAGAAGAMMMTRAMMGPYAYSPYGYPPMGMGMGMGMPMMPYGGYNPYGYGAPFMRPGMSSFFHY
jgi:hypothetical protein